MAFIDRLKAARLEKKLTQEQLAKEIGVAKPTYNGYEKGNSEPNMLILSKLMKVLGVDANYLFQDEMQIHRETHATPTEMEHIKKYRTLDGHGKKVVDFVLDEEAERVADERQRRLPVETEEEDNIVYVPFRCSTQSASAGTGTYLGPEAFETIYVRENDLTRRAAFGIPVSGDSMEHRYHNGDILIIEEAEESELGEIGVFSVDGSGYVKELGNGELISLNPTYDPIPMTESTWCHGRVIGVLDPEWIAEE